MKGMDMFIYLLCDTWNASQDGHRHEYGTVQAQVYTRARVKSRALACRGVRAPRVLGKDLTRENQYIHTYLCFTASITRKCKCSSYCSTGLFECSSIKLNNSSPAHRRLAYELLTWPIVYCNNLPHSTVSTKSSFTYASCFN